MIRLVRPTGNVVIYVRARPCATNREESYPKKVAHGPKSLSRYNDIVVSHIVIKGFYCSNKERPATIRHCCNYVKPNYNIRTCQVEGGMSDVYSSE